MPWSSGESASQIAERGKSCDKVCCNMPRNRVLVAASFDKSKVKRCTLKGLQSLSGDRKLSRAVRLSQWLRIQFNSRVIVVQNELITIFRERDM